LTSAFDLIRPNEFISSGNYHLYVGSLSDDKKKLQDVILIQSEPTPKGNAGKSADMNNTIDQETADQMGISDMPKDIINRNAKDISKDT
ncbi:hypothetical protein SB725_31685, partial [Pseudomonas sp. SIMBA_041]